MNNTIETTHDPADYGPMDFVLQHTFILPFGIAVCGNLHVKLSHQSPLIKATTCGFGSNVKLTDSIEYRRYISPYCKEAVEALAWNYPNVDYSKHLEFLKKWL